MSKTENHISSQKVIEFAEYCISNKQFGVKNFVGFCKMFGYPETNSSALKNGLVNLTPYYLEQVATTFGLNMNWIFGMSDQMFLAKNQKIHPLKQLKDAVTLIESHLNKISEK